MYKIKVHVIHQTYPTTLVLFDMDATTLLCVCVCVYIYIYIYTYTHVCVRVYISGIRSRFMSFIKHIQPLLCFLTWMLLHSSKSLA